MGLHPDNAVCFKRAPGHRVTVPEDSSSFQAPPPAAVALGLPEYKPLLSFSMTFSPSWRNLGQSLSLPASCFLSTNGNDGSYFSYSQDSYEDPLRKLIWKSYELISRVSVIQALLTLTHPLEMYQGQLPWVARRGRPWVGEHGIQVLGLRGPRKTTVNSDKHFNLLLPPFWSKFVSGMITTCKLFMPLSVKPACEIQFSVSSQISFKNVHIFFPVFPLSSLPCADCHGFVST